MPPAAVFTVSTKRLVKAFVKRNQEATRRRLKRVAVSDKRQVTAPRPVGGGTITTEDI